MNGFEVEEIKASNHNFLYDVRQPEDILFVVYVLNEQLDTILLTKNKMSQEYAGIPVGIVNDEVYIDGGRIGIGKHEVNGFTFLVLDSQKLHTHFLNFDNDEIVFSNKSENTAVQTSSSAYVLIEDKENVTMDVNPDNDFAYYNDQKLTSWTHLKFNVGDKLLLPDLLIERTMNDWKITTFSKDIRINTDYFWEHTGKSRLPQDFPEYRRSPRLNLEVPEETFKYEKIPNKEKAEKSGLMTAILAPLGMLLAGGVTTVLMGRSPLMLLATVIASLVTVIFTVVNYQTKKKDRIIANKQREEDYQTYLIKTTAKLARIHRQEMKVLNYQQPSPKDLLAKIQDYDSRLYERMVNNKDFLEVSLGTGQMPSHVTITTDYTDRDDDDWALHVKSLVEKYSAQDNVPVPLDLKRQSLGLIGNYENLKTTVSNLYLQLAFFHSYRDVNFISLVPEKSYKSDWHHWRFLPHFKLADINTRGIIHDAKSRDMVLSNFYQILSSRKQNLEASGREKPTFLPHYVFTVFDDSYLAGHGLNEYLAEDLSELGVTVIWCREDRKLLPETMTALVEIKNENLGILIQDKHVHLDKLYKPYPNLEEEEDFEVLLRYLTGLEHMEVEKNAIPERLSLLDQYMVETVEDLDIQKRWQEANPSKSIASVIGWKGKEELAYWDLDEQVHGPHAIVGGTSGSGKSEFLTTYLLGLAINFSPEDIGMLIIDWKGGGIADTLAALPHFMGSITNLDGAGTARALASINAELKKRQRVFREYGVQNIAGYTKLYREGKTNPQEERNYPNKPLPHLMLVSDEFAELKENVPEFLDELTSVARIGRSLGVHLILATQKPDGVVNDQIDANSKSKVALKMSDEANSKALIKTGDAAHITNAGRGYLRVGESEVYELFQSGYAGVDYNPHGNAQEVKDERIYAILPSGQHQLIYDPREEVVDQSGFKEELPSQLKATIQEINQIFKTSNYQKPDKPWLPNLEENIVTEPIKEKNKRELSIPLGLLDIPSLQEQRVYHFNLEETSHTVIFSSPGFGKSTVLQTLVMNLARQNTPEQVQFNLLDFGTNGLLPLKELPHVADIVTLEENEKLQKMLVRLENLLSERKALFKKVGVANLNQYQTKTKEELPVIITVLDSYDGLSQNDNRKDTIDNLLMKLLREGAALGLYLVLTAGRYNAVRMNMMANIQTKIALFLNEDSDLSSLFGRDKLEQTETPGRAQIKLDQPLALQIYLPTKGETSVEMLTALDKEIQKLSENWKGSVPEEIPMVPEELDTMVFKEYTHTLPENSIYIGLDKETSQAQVIEFFKGKSVGIFPENRKQFKVVAPFIFSEIFEKVTREIIVIDNLKSLEGYRESASIYISRDDIASQSLNLKETLKYLVSEEMNQPRLIIFNGIGDILDKLGYQQAEFTLLIEANSAFNQFVFMDVMSRVGSNFSMSTTVVRENVSQILFGGALNNQHFAENPPNEIKNMIFERNVLHSLEDDNLTQIVVPIERANKANE